MGVQLRLQAQVNGSLAQGHTTSHWWDGGLNLGLFAKIIANIRSARHVPNIVLSLLHELPRLLFTMTFEVGPMLTPFYR